MYVELDKEAPRLRGDERSEAKSMHSFAIIIP